MSARERDDGLPNCPDCGHNRYKTVEKLPIQSGLAVTMLVRENINFSKKKVACRYCGKERVV